MDNLTVITRADFFGNLTFNICPGFDGAYLKMFVPKRPNAEDVSDLIDRLIL